MNDLWALELCPDGTPGLDNAAQLCCTVFAAISGSSATTALTVAAIAAPQMTRMGYPTPITMGTIAAGGTLGILIPPSGPMVLYSLVTDASISALFIAGVVPGLAMVAIFSLYCFVLGLGSKAQGAPVSVDLRTYPVKVEGTRILVRVDGAEPES